jgi:DNA mismatch endonuclease (patch repair protein)
MVCKWNANFFLIEGEVNDIYSEKDFCDSQINLGIDSILKMTDVHNEQTRSFNMSQIRSKNTKPELLVRKYLFSNGFRFRLHDKNSPGKPDVLLPKYKTAIFVNGCFWHGHENCKYYVIPKTRTKFWADKIEGNKKRDIENIHLLEKIGWKVITIFECELKKENQLATLNNLLLSIQKNYTEK